MEPPMNLSFVTVDGLLGIIAVLAFIGLIFLCEKYGPRKPK